MGLPMSFIRLTASRRNQPILINIADISFIQKAESTDDTYVRLNKNDDEGEPFFYFVNESFDDIAGKLTNG